MADAAPLLEVDHLTTIFDLPSGPAPAVDGVSFVVRPGETLGLVGESGSGKSVTALSILRLVLPPGRIAGGAVRFRGRDLLALSERELQAVRGAGIGFVFQEPAAALNPVLTIGSQIVETIEVHGRVRGRDARAQAVALLRAVRMPDPERRFHEYPHQLSGGLRQRAVIALALAASPALLIADEPTTALDVTVQAEILELLASLKADYGLALLLITHDFGVIAGTADRVAVMYAGRLVEEGPVRDVLRDPRHPYTRALLDAIPSGRPGTPLRAIPGSVPALGRLPAGCAFAPRCPARLEVCKTRPPGPTTLGPDRRVRCFLYSDA